MRFKQYNGGGYGLNGLTPSGGVIGAPLYLPITPTEDMHAATKDYADKTLSSISVANITGNIPAERLPAFTGNDISSVGHGIFELKASGVAAGTYNKVTVNAKGVVTAGELIDYSLITNVPWSSITSGKPTTLEGCGITDALKTSGGTMTGGLFITDAPTLSTHLSNKSYVDSAAAARIAQGVGKIGDVIQTSVTTPPTNYMRANGAILDKTTYSALYAIIGDTYSAIGGGAGDYMGQPWRQQYAFNPTDNGVSQTWAAGVALPGTVAISQAIVTKNRVYLLGGDINGTHSATVYTAPINADGTLGTWTTATALPGTVAYSQAIVTKNRVYLLGGDINGTHSATVYTAPINTDGTLDTWTTATALPGTVAYSQAIVTKNRVYLLGGYNGAFSSTVYTAPINADGTLGTWTTATALPAPVTYSQAIVTKNRVYLLGGYINGAFSSTVYTAPINADGTLGTWTTATALPGTVTYSQAIVTNNRVYLLGGLINGASSATVYTAPINTDGTLGTWTTATALPATVYYSQAIVTKNRVYLLGGIINGDPSSTVYTIPFAGGTNDYLTLIAANTLDVVTQFKLPDTTLTDPVGAYSYIRAV